MKNAPVGNRPGFCLLVWLGVATAIRAKISFAKPCDRSFWRLSRFFPSSMPSRSSWRSLTRSRKRLSCPCRRASSNWPDRLSCTAHLCHSTIFRSYHRSRKKQSISHLRSAPFSAHSFGRLLYPTPSFGNKRTWLSHWERRAAVNHPELPSAPMRRRQEPASGRAIYISCRTSQVEGKRIPHLASQEGI